MSPVPLSKTKIETKLAIIREALTELAKFRPISRADFIADKDNFAIAEHYLRRALEAIFDISGHIISRYPYSPGKRPSTFKEIALALGDKGVIDETFARETLVKMAGYRNRMVHFYAELTAEELYLIVKEKLSDIEKFSEAIINLVKNPKKLDLGIEE